MRVHCSTRLPNQCFTLNCLLYVSFFLLFKFNRCCCWPGDPRLLAYYLIFCCPLFALFLSSFIYLISVFVCLRLFVNRRVIYLIWFFPSFIHFCRPLIHTPHDVNEWLLVYYNFSQRDAYRRTELLTVMWVKRGRLLDWQESHYNVRLWVTYDKTC